MVRKDFVAVYYFQKKNGIAEKAKDTTFCIVILHCISLKNFGSSQRYDVRNIPAA